MSRTYKQEKGPGYEYWSPRPGNFKERVRGKRSIIKDTREAYGPESI